MRSGSLLGLFQMKNVNWCWQFRDRTVETYVYASLKELWILEVEWCVGLLKTRGSTHNSKVFWYSKPRLLISPPGDRLNPGLLSGWAYYPRSSIGTVYRLLCENSVPRQTGLNKRVGLLTMGLLSGVYCITVYCRRCTFFWYSFNRRKNVFFTSLLNNFFPTCG